MVNRNRNLVNKDPIFIEVITLENFTILKYLNLREKPILNKIIPLNPQ